MSQIDVSLKGPISKSPAGGFALDAAFTVPAAGITAVWGPSGSGKTTLLRAISGLARLSGHVRIGDATWQDSRTFVSVHKRGVGYVFQEASLFPHLTVHGNLDYARKRSVAGDFDSIVDLLHIRDLLSRGVGALSGGERQRVALARTLLSAPGLLLMDEPLSSLDTAAKADILPLIRQIGQRLPILYVSHDVSEVATLADRVLRIQAGQVMAAEAPASLAGLSDAQIRALAQAALAAGLQP
ncbi:MAG TPA: ATP-binding cassette domain-containing protein [Asticcacaulis sp.]|nr:ATP-binding cassette domain-containing protein [Asticcacaulis sp.]